MESFLSRESFLRRKLYREFRENEKFKTILQAFLYPIHARLISLALIKLQAIFSE